ncbi:MAG: hypothetical protein AB7P69_21615 [Candidatus Binatia bacterium]
MSTIPRSGQIDFDLAVLDPSAVFATPEEILACDTLSQQQKITLLQQWQYDASSVAVAEEEGMISDKELLLQRIVQALHKLTGGVNVERTGPTKQSGF